MRIYFAPCGIALGHAGRCIPVAKAFRERGHEVYFSTYGEAVQFVKKAGFRVGEAPPIRLFEREDGSFDLRRTLSRGPRSLYNFTLQIGAELDLIEHFKPDLVISDSRLSTIMASRMRRIIPILILHQLRIMIPHKKPITDQVRREVKSHVERLGLEVLGRLWRLSKVIIVPDFPPPYTIAKENVVPSYQYINKLRLVGPIIPKYPKDLPPTDELKKSLGFDDRPLIFAAISGTLAEKRMIVGKLIEIFREFPDSYNIVVTRGLSGNPPRCNSDLRNKRLKVFDWVDDRYKYLKACDLLITRGGHNTVSEAMYYGKPMVVIPTIAHSEHQGIADAVVKMRLGAKIQQEDLSKEALLGAIRSLVDSSYYFYNVKRAQQFSSRFNAVETIYGIASDLLGIPHKTY